MGQYTETDDEYPPLRYHYALLKCPRCGLPFLVCVSDDEAYPVYIDEVVIYPSSLGRFDRSVPRAIASSHQEAVKCFEAKAYTACSIMCRRTVELICLEKGASKFNLKDKLAELKASNTLDARIHEWADYVLRDAGNEAAHELDYVATRDVAKDQLDFCKAIIEYVYVFTAAFERFKQRRSAAESQPTSTA